MDAIQKKQLEILSRLGPQINESLDLTRILRTLVCAAVSLTRAKKGASWLRKNGSVELINFLEDEQFKAISYELKMGECIPGHVMKTQKPYFSNDLKSDPYSQGQYVKDFTVTEIISIPIISRSNELLGCFDVMNTENGLGFHEEDISLLEGLAGHAAVAIENARIFEQRVKAEEGLRKLATAVMQTPESIVITDAHGKIEYVNPAFEKITGYSRQEMIGGNPRMLKSGKHSEEFYHELWTTLTSGNVWHGRITNRRKDGTLFEEEATISPVRNESGDVVNYVAVKRDVTREAELETQLLHSQKLEAVGLLAGGVAHDFNNILMAVTGYTELMKFKVNGNPTLTHDLNEIQRALDQGASLTRQLLAFSRKQVLEPKVVDFNQIVSEMEEMLMRLIGEDVEMEIIKSPALGHTMADRGQMEQVVMNLVVNARDAMPKGGKLTIQTQNVFFGDEYISEHLKVIPGHYVMISVSDTGIGMDEATIARIFEPFYTTKEKGRGTGLGLSTVYGIIKQSGGYIWVYSEPGLGTTFKFYLPRVDQPNDLDASDSSTVDIAGGSETILLVDDNEPVRFSIGAVLENVGYKVLLASNGEEAVRLFEGSTERVHLLLTDVVMPRMSGIEVAEKLQSKSKGIRIIFMSGYTEEAVKRHGSLSPDSIFLQKPATIQTILCKIRELLDR